MTRPFRLSEQSYNDQLYDLNEVLKNINSTKENLPSDPKEGALWLDRTSGDLMYYSGSKWIEVHKDKFRLVTEIMNATPPSSPYDGQLWINNGILKYFSVNANQWIPIKSILANTQNDIDVNSFEPFMLINKLTPSGDDIAIKSLVFSYIKEEEFNATDKQKTFTLQKGLYKPGTHSLEVYVNGIRIPYSGIDEDMNGKNVNFVNQNAIVAGDRVVIVYKIADTISEIASVVEEEFTATHNQQDYPLTKGTFTAGLRAVKVYVNGSKVPYSGIYEHPTGNMISLENASAINDGDNVVINYRLADFNKITDAMEEEFVASLNQEQYTVTTSSFMPGFETVEMYVNGLRVPFSGIVEGDDGATVSLADGSAIQDGDKIVVCYRPADNMQQIINLTKMTDTNTKYVLKSQFLMPSTDFGKFFVDGAFTDAYDIISQVAIQYEIEKISGKKASVVHVNPAKLTGLKKKVIHFDKANPVISVPEYNTEYYGFYGGLGRLLVKDGDTSVSDYFSAQNGGILLNSKAAQTFDFVTSVTYEFGDVSGIGYQVRERDHQVKGAGVYIGKIQGSLLVFIDGKFVPENIDNYTYNRYTGFVKFSPAQQEFISNNDSSIQITSFDNKQEGKIMSLDVNGKGVISLGSQFTNPIVFILGKDITEDMVSYNSNFTEAYVTGAIVGDSYSVVESNGAFVESGVVSATRSVPTSSSSVPLDFTPMLFVDGVLQPTKSLQRKPDRTVTTTTLTVGQKFMLLNKSFIYEGNVNSLTIPLRERVDSLIVYAYNSLLCDLDTVYKAKKPEATDTGYEGEIATYIEGGVSKWAVYRVATGWTDLDPVADADLITNLDSSLVTYSASNTSIDFLQNVNSTAISYIGYVYADTISNPLLYSTVTPVDKQAIYDVYYTHNYVPGTKGLSVFLNGQRLYAPTVGSLADPASDVQEVSATSFEIPYVLTDNHRPVEDEYSLFYVIENTDQDEYNACQKYILTKDDAIDGMFSTYSRNGMSLYPGNVRVFIGGYRQPSSAYQIINNNTISFDHELSSHDTEYQIKVFDDLGVPSIKTCKKVTDQILIEVRQDMALREKTCPIRQRQTVWSVGTDGIPAALLKSKDRIMIYINGAAYGGEYKIELNSPDGGHIELLDLDMRIGTKVTDILSVDNIANFFEANPDKYEEWKKQNGGQDYVRKDYFNNPIDFITFEWR
jgi:hypothetical protein